MILQNIKIFILLSMRNLLKTLNVASRTTSFIFIFLLGGCVALVPPIELGLKAVTYKKDVSSDPQRGYIVGKQFEIVRDLNLFGFQGESDLFLVEYVPQKEVFDPNDYSYFKKVPKGTILNVSKVLVKASHLSGELCLKFIMGTLVNKEGNPLFVNQEGVPTSVDVSSLFKHTDFEPDEDWIFKPDPDLLLEVSLDPTVVSPVAT